MKNKHTAVVNPRIVFTFKIGGKGTLPEATESVTRHLVSPPWQTDHARIANGETLFWRYCGTCHVVAENGGGVAPDLGYSVYVGNEDFEKVVLKGALLINGMPQFSNRLNRQDITDIQHYIINRVSSKKD